MNKNVLIIGGNSGIGRRLKYYFNKNNYKVFATARNKKNLIKYDLNNVTKKKFLNKDQIYTWYQPLPLFLAR